MTELWEGSIPTLPGYQCLEPLGAGASGRVWRALRLRDGAEVAVKVVDGAAEQAVREGLLVGQRCEHVVTVHDLVQVDEERRALVMDLMRGGSLRQAVAARGRLSAGECVTVLTPIATALGSLHRRGLVHGDLSPDNVLFDLAGRPHLADLGACHAAGEVPGDVHGTDGFVAPEVLAGEQPGSASDVHAVGALGWFCLTGEEPDLALVRGTFVGHLARTGAREDLPPSLVDVLDGALVLDASARPSADALAVAVFDTASPEPLHVAPGGDATAGLTRRLRAAMDAGEGDRPREVPSVARRRRLGRTRPGRSSGAGPGAPRWARPPAARLVASALVLSFLALAIGAVIVLRQRPWLAQAAAADPAGSVAASPTAGGTRDGGSLGAQVRHPTAADLVPLVQALSDLRAANWSAPEGAGWESASVPGSPAHSADERDQGQLRAAGSRAEGLRLTVRQASWANGPPDWHAHPEVATILVRAVVDTSAHELVSADGRQPRAAEAGAPLDLDLRWSGQRWQVWEVRVPG